jgi:hypothetical protein
MQEAGVVRQPEFVERRSGERRKPTFQEPHFTPRELAQGWGLSDDTIRRWFEDEPGVLKGGVDGSRGRRRKMFLRIPASVAQRVYEERTK